MPDSLPWARLPRTREYATSSSPRSFSSLFSALLPGFSPGRLPFCLGHILSEGQGGRMESSQRLQTPPNRPGVQHLPRFQLNPPACLILRAVGDHSLLHERGVASSRKCFFLLAGVKRVVDLCAAPGSWSQVSFCPIAHPYLSFLLWTFGCLRCSWNLQVLSRNLYVPAKQSPHCK